MSVFDPGIEEAGPTWARHNLSDHDDCYTAGAGHLSDMAFNARIGKWVPNSALSVPTLAYAAGAGTSPPATPTLSADSNDDRFNVSFGTGTSPPAQSAGQPLVTVVFGTPFLTPSAQTQALTANAASGQAVVALSNLLPLPNPGQSVVLAGGTTETLTVLSVNYATGAVTFTANLANPHASGSAANWSVAKIPYIDIQELGFAARNLLLYPTSISATGFTISYAGTTIAASQGATVFQATVKVEG